MIGLIRDRMDKYLGRGRHSIAVPVMDGPLHPNRGLDNAEALFSLDGVDNLTVEGDAIWCSSGSRLMRATGGAPQQVAEMEAQIACLAADGTGALTVGLDGKGLVIRGGAHDGTRIEKLGGSALTCPTAACFLDADTLAVTVGAVKRQSAEWKRDLMEEVDRTVSHMKDEAANFPDPNDRATQEEEFSLELRTRDRERKLIRKIEEALKRIDDGSYGYCLETGEEIGIKRLEARPVATLSIEAQERRERREKQYGDRDDRYR